MKMKRNIFGFVVVLLYSMICLIIANTTYADTYNVDGYTVSQNNNIISVTDSQTGLSAYLDIIESKDLVLHRSGLSLFIF
ncbi:hypothetical protein ACVR0O_03515 [Streptococcus caviae]|uniref:hypothetical protein n=1 Tax=Streptococcus sp. 'caviae' TaxID=1915004 RepID=UPI00094B7E47|nr:hypothetical protein [Streptococcus sp. 'caviae']OLN82627.1 hypothetical protein BMI76_08090 [Streptococcus sp. 'caviae']